MISTLLQALKDHLDAQEYFSDSQSNPAKPIPVLLENVGEPSAEVQALVEVLGISVLITTPDFSNLNDAKPKVISEPEIILQVVETVYINQSTTGTNKKALDVVEKIVEFLHFFHNGDFGRLLFQYTKRQNDAPLVYWVTFKSRFDIKPLATNSTIP